ncbi:MAG: CHAT domain-containing tetratricopeptide repeat protein [Bacteroidota bacterium]
MRLVITLSLSMFFALTAFCQDSNEYAKKSFEELDSLINEQIDQAKYQDAIPIIGTFIKKAQKDKNDLLEAKGLAYYGLLYWGLGKYGQSLTFHLEAKGIREKVFGKEHPHYIESLNSVGIVHWYMGDYNKALPFLLQSEELSKKVLGEENSKYANSLNNLGYFYQEIGSHDKALPLHLKATRIYGKSLGKEHPDYAVSLNNLALLYRSMGNYSEALQLFLQAKDIYDKLPSKNQVSYADFLNNLANIHYRMNNYDKALPIYLRAKDIYGKVLGEEHPYYAVALNNLANLYDGMRDFKKSLPLHQQAKEIRKKALGKDHPLYATSLNNLATWHRRMGNHDQAVALFIEAQGIYEKVWGKEHFLYANSLNNLALFYKEIGNYNQALPFFLEARSIRKKVLGKQHPIYINMLNHMAALYERVGNYDKAWELLQEVMNNHTKAQLPASLNNTSFYDTLLSVTYPSIKHLEEVLVSLEVVYQLLETDSSIRDAQAKRIKVADIANALLIKARNQVSNENDKLRMLSYSHDWLRANLDLLTSDIHAYDAFNLVDQNKSVLLLQATKSDLAYQLGELPDSLVWQDRKLLKKQSELQVKLLEKGNEKESLRSELIEVNEDIDEFVKMIETEYPKYHKIKYQQADVKVEDVQASLNSNTALLEYVVGDSLVHIFCVYKNEVRWSKTFVSNQELKNRIKLLHTALSDYLSEQSYSEFTENGHWFYQHLIAPALKDKDDIANLIIVTDGELGHLPFETFLVEPVLDNKTDYRGLHYLLKDYNISYNYSAALWKENVEASAPQNNGQILGVAANYDMALDSSMLTVRLPTDQWTRAEISPLPGAREEVEILQKKYAGFFAFDSLASEKTVKAMASNFSILHFATHGILDRERPVLSSLAFTENNDSTESNFWQAHEISKLQLNADMVVLSACQTGYGKFEKGNGIASLARAFMYAGAPSLVVSLWQVRDNTTATLMQNFYENLDQGMQKDEALRQAKLQYIKSAHGFTAHPAYWAPFIMIGKTDPVEIKQKSNPMAWGIGIGVFALLMIGGFMLRRRVA